jgi:hypothetical protein
VTLAYLEYERHGRIAGMHHTLFPLKKKSTEISEMLKIVVGQEMGKHKYLSISPSTKVVRPLSQLLNTQMCIIRQTDENVD